MMNAKKRKAELMAIKEQFKRMAAAADSESCSPFFDNFAARAQALADAETEDAEMMAEYNRLCAIPRDKRTDAQITRLRELAADDIGSLLSSRKSEDAVLLALEKLRADLFPTKADAEPSGDVAAHRNQFLAFRQTWEGSMRGVIKYGLNGSYPNWEQLCKDFISCIDGELAP